MIKDKATGGNMFQILRSALVNGKKKMFVGVMEKNKLERELQSKMKVLQTREIKDSIQVLILIIWGDQHSMRCKRTLKGFSFNIRDLKERGLSSAGKCGVRESMLHK